MGSNEVSMTPAQPDAVVELAARKLADWLEYWQGKLTKQEKIKALADAMKAITGNANPLAETSIRWVDTDGSEHVWPCKSHHGMKIYPNGEMADMKSLVAELTCLAENRPDPLPLLHTSKALSQVIDKLQRKCRAEGASMVRDEIKRVVDYSYPDFYIVRGKAIFVLNHEDQGPFLRDSACSDEAMAVIGEALNLMVRRTALYEVGDVVVKNLTREGCAPAPDPNANPLDGWYWEDVLALARWAKNRIGGDYLTPPPRRREKAAND